MLCYGCARCICICFISSYVFHVLDACCFPGQDGRRRVHGTLVASLCIFRWRDARGRQKALRLVGALRGRRRRRGSSSAVLVVGTRRAETSLASFCEPLAIAWGALRAEAAAALMPALRRQMSQGARKGARGGDLLTLLRGLWQAALAADPGQS